MQWYNTLQNIIRSQPEKTALVWLDPIEGRTTLTYEKLGEQIANAADHLRASGIKGGERVGILLPKSLPFIYYHLAIMRLGAVSLPLNPAATANELDYAITDAEVTAVLVNDQTGKRIESLHEGMALFINRQEPAPPPPTLGRLMTPDGNSTALMIYTSGTTGRPKGAEITHNNLTAQLDALAVAWGWTQNDRLLHVLPLFHVHGLIVALQAALHTGATTYLLPHFETIDAIHNLAENRCTIFMGVPTMYYRMVQAKEPNSPDLSSVRLYTCGSDRLPEDLFHAFQTKFGQTILERYGMTETGMLLSNPLHGERRPGSVGRPLPGVEARIVDAARDHPLPDGQIGEVQVRGPNVFKGYWHQPEQTAMAFTADGWFRTGDLGLRTADGYFTLKGRAKELIITGGFNVYPSEVERVLTTHPAVMACAVFGCPDEEWGERVVAAVTLQGSIDGADVVAGLFAHCRSHLARYKVPQAIQIEPDLPRNSMGKIVKGELRRRYCHEKAT